MKVLLIYPPFLNERVSSDDVSFVPMGLYNVAAVLRDQGHDAQVANWHMPDLDMDQAVKTIDSFNPDVVGFSIVNGNRFGATDMAQAIKNRLPGITTVVGGIGATFLWDHLLKHYPQLDYAVVGEGEEAMTALVSCIQNNTLKKICHIPGVATVINGIPVLESIAPFIQNIDALPSPAKYFKYQHLSLSRGCPHDCTFCGSPKFWGRKMRFHSPEYFLEQVRKLTKGGVSFLYVSDDTFTLKKDLVISVCKQMVEEQIPVSWNAISRVDRVDEDILYWMRKAGCIQISYGVESGCERTRDLLNKNMSTPDILRAFQLTTSLGILSRAYFIYGCPGEGPEVLQANLDFMDAISPLGAVFYILDMFPGTKLYDDYIKQNNLTDDIWLERKEDIMYWETDPNLDLDLITRTGDTLRVHFFKHLPEYVSKVHLVDNPDLVAEHGDFYSRLGMTFTLGDYSNDHRIPHPEKVAATLFEKSLECHQSPRPYLGLGILHQRTRAFQESASILNQGLDLFPQDEQIRLHLSTSLMNLGNFLQAKEHLITISHLPQARHLVEQCNVALKQ